MSELQRKDFSREVAVLDPAKLSVRTDAQGRLALCLPNGASYTGARLYPAFPISRRHTFVCLYAEDGAELGIIQDPRQLDPESRDLVLAECDRVYFLPRITRVHRVTERNGVAEWVVETDRGDCTFQVVSRSDSIWSIGRSRLLIRDVDGNRYMIPDRSKMDKRSKILVELNI